LRIIRWRRLAIFVEIMEYPMGEVWPSILNKDFSVFSKHMDFIFFPKRESSLKNLSRIPILRLFESLADLYSIFNFAKEG
jgi:hypothetical protein